MTDAPGAILHQQASINTDQFIELSVATDNMGFGAMLGKIFTVAFYVTPLDVAYSSGTPIMRLNTSGPGGSDNQPVAGATIPVGTRYLFRTTLDWTNVTGINFVRLMQGVNSPGARVLFENLTVVDGSFPDLVPFNGSDPNTGDWINVWSGPNNASVSRQLAVKVATNSGVSQQLPRWITYQARENDRTYVRNYRYSQGASNWSIFRAQSGTMDGVTTPFTVVAWLRSNNLTNASFEWNVGGSNDSVPRRFLGDSATSLTPNEWTLVRILFTPSKAVAGNSAFHHNLVAGTGSYYDVDELTIVMGEHPDLMPIPNETHRYKNQMVTPVWNGTPFASTRSVNYYEELVAAGNLGDAYILAGGIYIFSMLGYWEKYGNAPVGL